MMNEPVLIHYCHLKPLLYWGSLVFPKVLSPVQDITLCFMSCLFKLLLL